jgi:hypothetical protein
MFEMRGFVVNAFGGEQFVDYVSVAITWALAVHEYDGVSVDRKDPVFDKARRKEDRKNRNGW